MNKTKITLTVSNVDGRRQWIEDLDLGDHPAPISDSSIIKFAKGYMAGLSERFKRTVELKSITETKTRTI